MRSTQRMPFGFNPKVERRNARLRRLIRKHGTKPMTKAEARQMLAQVERILSDKPDR